MKGKHPQKRVNPIPMITTITFQACFEKTGTKKRDTHCHSDSLV